MGNRNRHEYSMKKSKGNATDQSTTNLKNAFMGSQLDCTQRKKFNELNSMSKLGIYAGNTSTLVVLRQEDYKFKVNSELKTSLEYTAIPYFIKATNHKSRKLRTPSSITPLLKKHVLLKKKKHTQTQVRGGKSHSYLQNRKDLKIKQNYSQNPGKEMKIVFKEKCPTYNSIFSEIIFKIKVKLRFSQININRGFIARRLAFQDMLKIFLVGHSGEPVIQLLGRLGQEDQKLSPAWATLGNFKI